MSEDQPGDDLCQCPNCGRMHKNLGFGKPPAAPQDHNTFVREAMLVVGQKLIDQGTVSAQLVAIELPLWQRLRTSLGLGWTAW